jgi:hypothetical protein
MAYRMFSFDPLTATIYVSNAYEGLAIEVDYDYYDDTDPSRRSLHCVRGELHTVQWGQRPLLASETSAQVQHNTHVALYGPWREYRAEAAPPGSMAPFDVRVLAVRGASAKARTWWAAESGLIKMVDVDTHLQREKS